MKKVRTRIAPSPTGYMHIGTLHTALFNYFFAKQSDGDFILRIEDTDRTRFVDGATENLISIFAKLDIEFSEGPIVKNGKLIDSGEFGPYIQSQRLDIYKKYVDRLLEQGKAYNCFCTKERLDNMRKKQQEAKQTPKYDRNCLGLSDDEVKKRLSQGEASVVRLRVPEGETVVCDLIHGDITFAHSDIDDQVLLKSDGFPTYHLAVVVDDELMAITHVIRGEEWLSSTPKHILLQNMFGFTIPVYAHLPHLLNQDKTKLSKRQGDVAVEDYLKKGYLKETMLNFIGTLGFNPSGDREVYSLEELIEAFDLAKVKKSGAIMNHEKLDWMNHHYLVSLPETVFLSRASEFVLSLDSDQMRKAALIERQRIDRLDQLQSHLDAYDQPNSYDPSLLVWKKADAQDAKNQLKEIQTHLSAMTEADFDSVIAIERKIKGYIETNGLNNGNVLWPLRVALSGKEQSASPFEYLWIFGKRESILRVKRALDLL